MRFLLGILVALAACGDDDGINQIPDAPIPPDTAPDTPQAGVVTLTITVDGAAASGVTVVFQNADSSLVAETTTDENGVASATMEAGGYVTAIDPFARPVPAGVAARELRTFAGVKPGDELRLTRDRTIPAVDVTLTFTAEPNAVSYQLLASCMGFPIDVTDTDGSGGTPGPGGPVTLDGCAPGPADLVVVALDATGTPIRSLHQAGVELAQDATIDLGGAYADTEDVSFSYTGVPAGLGALDVELFRVTARGRVTEGFSSALIDNNAATPAPVKAAAVPDAVQVVDTRLFGAPFGIHNVIEWGAPATSYTLDLADALTPDYTAAPQLDVDGHRVTWTAAATAVAPDFALVDVFVVRETPSQVWNWLIVAPHTETAVVLPVLPGEGATFNPVASDDASVFELTTATVPGGYDAIRARVFALDSDLGLVTGPSGRVVFQELQLGKLRGKSSRARPRPWLRRAMPRR